MTAISRQTNHLRTILWDSYQYREVLYNILSRDLKVKYKRTTLGYFWSLLNPIFQIGVMAAVFSHLVRQDMHDYTLYLFSGFIAWSFFQNALVLSSTVYLENENFIRKVYLPKLIFPLSKLCFRMIDFFFSLVALSILGMILGFQFHLSVIALPAAILLLFVFTLGCALLISIGTVFFRDVQYLLGVFLQLLYFATPILYPLSALPEKYHVWLKLNPLFSQIQIFQRILYDGVFPTTQEWGLAVSTSLGMFLLGLAVLMRQEDELVFRM